MLHKLPGITERNYRSVLSRCECLADLATMSQADIQVCFCLPQSDRHRHLFTFESRAEGDGAVCVGVLAGHRRCWVTSTRASRSTSFCMRNAPW
jgi:hypothetical protein